MSLQYLENCPVCNSTAFQPVVECKDYTSSNDVFHVEQCTCCGFAFTNPRPSIQDAGGYYQSTSYISHQSKATSIIDRIYLIMRHLTIKWKYGLVKNSLADKHGAILDFGCGTGTFLDYCKSNGQDTFGIEPSDSARSASTEMGLRVVQNLSMLPNKKFDVITLWHVLEHVYPLNETLQLLIKLLKENGTIFIAVPNWKSQDARRYGSAWAAYDVPRHIWHFSQASMRKLLSNHGLHIKRTIPMKLDAYYVSILSEKYINQNKHSLSTTTKGVYRALRSNAKARKDMNYSSLIYEIQK